VWGQQGSFPYSESLQSLSVNLVLSNKYQKTFRLSPILPERDERAKSQLTGLINTTAFGGRLTR
jgi:hypothetical protein